MKVFVDTFELYCSKTFLSTFVRFRLRFGTERQTPDLVTKKHNVAI